MCSLPGPYLQVVRPQRPPPAAHRLLPWVPRASSYAVCLIPKSPTSQAQGFSLSLRDLPSVFLSCYPAASPSAGPALGPVSQIQLGHSPASLHFRVSTRARVLSSCARTSAVASQQAAACFRTFRLRPGFHPSSWERGLPKEPSVRFCHPQCLPHICPDHSVGLTVGLVSMPGS